MLSKFKIFVRLIYTGLLCVLLFQSGSFSQEITEVINEPDANQVSADTEFKFNFSVDWNRFRYNDSLTYFEFTATLYRTLLKYVPEEDGSFSAKFLVDAELIDGDSVIAKKQWLNINKVDSLEQIDNNQRLYCANSFIIGPGEYQFKITISDPNAEDREAAGIFPVTITNFPENELLLSDLQFASSIQKDTSQSIFVKNGYRIMPNPMTLYGIGLPILYCYNEIYNLKTATTDSGAKYIVNYSILDKDGKLVKTLPVKERTKPGTSSVEVNGINVVTLISGPYFLLMEVEDKETGEKVNAQRKFFVYREGDFAEGGALYKSREEIAEEGSPGLDADRYDVMSEKEIDLEFEYATYISSSEERSTFKKLNLDGKRNFIKEFWAKRDQSAGTPANEYKQDYLGRVTLANRSYKGTFRSGWKSDRGRILLVYGKPDEIDRFPFSTENKPYEIWHYYSIQGGVVFIFVDRRDMGDMELVHSTARGELYDQDWTRWISPTGVSDYDYSGY
ncbi:GWxTD domain-containing protein [candidate division KSB1 bacterium]|nr:GWxTD domain-containing protein [candidate division KSB1 bacterium]